MGQTNYNGALQQPIGSGFNAKSTSEEVIKGIDLKGKVAIVTGGNTGIGLETTKTLAKAGATVIVLARDFEKAKKNLRGIDNVEIEEMDLTNSASIDTFATKFLASDRPLHLLINNAGIMWVPLRRDSRGYESQLVTNYLAQFQLTARLWTALKKADGARVVNVSSQGHQFAPFNFDDPNFDHREYETLQGYGQSKTAVNLFSVELDNRAKEYGVRAYAVHPGSIAGTELGREASLELFQKMGFLDSDGNMLPEVTASLKTIPQGASTSIWCATSPLLNDIGGVYCEDTNIAQLASDTEVSNGIKRYSLDEADAKRLWKLSEQLTGVKFQFNDLRGKMENLENFNPEQLLFIDGKLTASESGETYEVINPTTEEVAGKVSAANTVDADLALDAAKRCFNETDWSTNTAKRIRALTQLRNGLLAVADEWRHYLVAESGVPLAFTYGPMLNSSITDINYSLELLNSYEFEQEIEDLGSPMGGPARRIVRKEAAGVVVAITPWNAPVQTNLQKVIPTLASGCTVVLKAANNTPWAATMIGRVASQCPDLPAGSLNILTSSPNANIGSLLTSDPRVDVVSFTGSTTTGSRVMENAAKTIKKTLLELGGKSAMIILDDADFEQSLPAAAFVCSNAGQGCILNTRLLVPRSRYAEAIAILEVIYRNIPYGDPSDINNIMGPMISAAQRKTVLSYIEKGKAEGARLVVGGGIPKDCTKGFYIEPTLFADVDNKMAIAQEEIFGPVLVVIPFDDDDDAIRIANDSIYGLSGSVVSASLERAMHVARSVRTGTMNVNGAFFFSANAPFGGYKQSGIGRENGVAGFEEYLEIKTIAIPITANV